MARQRNDSDLTPTLAAAASWIDRCLVDDGSIFTDKTLWTPTLIDEVRQAFVEHPDDGEADFLTKLKDQLARAGSDARQLCAEMLWVILLFPTNIRTSTKGRIIREMWELSADTFPGESVNLSESVLRGIGSGGPGYNTYRPDELESLISIVGTLKNTNRDLRRSLLHDYDAFCSWMTRVPQKGHRQLRHMFRYFAFPDVVERISSNNDRSRILDTFGCASLQDTRTWSDRDLDGALLRLRQSLEEKHPRIVLDFYESPLLEMWAANRLKTPAGDVLIVVPADNLEALNVEPDSSAFDDHRQEVRPSYVAQSRLASIGSKMGFKVWIPASDRQTVRSLLDPDAAKALINDLPLNYDRVTIATIRQIDVIWLRGRSMARAFEVEHTTAVYSGLLRMADLLALQPNMDIRLHIVAPFERRQKVFSEIRRPVFALLDRGPLSKSCSFISYESISKINDLPHLADISDGILQEYEEKAAAEVEEDDDLE